MDQITRTHAYNYVGSSNRRQHSHHISRSYSGMQMQNHQRCAPKAHGRRMFQAATSSTPYIPPFPGAEMFAPPGMPVIPSPSSPTPMQCHTSYLPHHPQHPSPHAIGYPSPPASQISEPPQSQKMPGVHGELKKLCSEDGYRLMVMLPVGHRDDGTYGVLPQPPDDENYTMSKYYVDQLTYYNMPEFYPNK